MRPRFLILSNPVSSVFKFLILASALTGMAGLPATARAQTDAMPPETMALPAKSAPTGPLKITYAGKTEVWTPATLAALPHKTIQVFNAHTKTNQTYSGVPLSDLLTHIGVPADPHGKEMRLYVTAHGSDGYFVVLSAAEVNPSIHPGEVIVADALEGKPIAETGPLQLIVSEDKRPARWVHNLVEIRVSMAE
jgi:hypothetical protein